MTQEKPPCADFILAAARHIRMNPANIVPGTKAGVALYRLFRVSREAYTSKRFVRGLVRLLKTERSLWSPKSAPTRDKTKQTSAVVDRGAPCS